MIIHNGKIITWEIPNRILEGYAIHIEGDRITDVLPKQEIINTYPDDELIDAHDQFVMPGNICAHTHFYGAFARGLGIPGSAPKDFPEILQKLWWPLDKSLSEEDVYYSALVCLVDAIRHGTTTLFDHHASPNSIDGSLDCIADAVEQSGLRASLCYEVTDRDGIAKAKAGIKENIRFSAAMKRLQNPKLRASFGLHASLTLSETTLDQCRESVGEDIGFHIHVAEHQIDEYDSINKTGTHVVDRLKKHNILGPNTIVVHAVHVDSQEIRLLADSRTWVTHQPRSNMNNAVGLPAVESMLRSGVKVCLGNDGFSNAMWEEWKACYFAHKLLHRDPQRLNGTTLIDMAVYNNAEMAKRVFNSPIGLIASGALADIIFVNYQPFTPLTADNLPWHILFGFHESMITTTIASGRILMKDCLLTTLDAEEISRHAKERAINVWRRYETLF